MLDPELTMGMLKYSEGRTLSSATYFKCVKKIS